MSDMMFKGKKINYRIQGEGKPVFLVHGYLETLGIWDDFADKLAEEFQVILMDVPGHGKSEVVEDTHHMELHAQAAKQLLDENHIESCTMIGHSMGGYIALAFAELYPETLDGFALFHSHPFADSEQVKQNRQKAIEKIQAGKKEEIIRNHLPKTFADDNVNRFMEKIDGAIEVGLEIPENGIVANLKGMMTRPDRSSLVKQTNKPFLLIAGKKDNFMDFNTIVPKVDLPESGRLETLEHSGHMGFVEEKDRSLQAIRAFVNQ